MFGTKIRSWMEAHIVRPRKKQHRKDATSKKRAENGNGKDLPEISPVTLVETRISAISTFSSTETSEVSARSSKTGLASDQARTQYQRQNNSTNLSSPESAYSTGYSTDGTSPGTSFPAATPAPEYYINIRTGTRYFHSTTSDVPLRLLLPGGGQQVVPPAPPAAPAPVESAANSCVASPALTSPRQRNRIRTNPWVSTNNATNCNCSPLHVSIGRQNILSQNQPPTPGMRNTILAATASPVRRKWSCADKKQRCMKCGACARFEAFSSSSSSSLSVSSVHRAVVRPNTSVASDDEDDRTLNEMMGKYDESYVYEKETDILSDSDPTDCDEEYDDTDAEAGREGGDERDPLTDEDDFDFIDNGSLELNIGDDETFVNMGHCTYHNFQQQDDTNTLVPRRRESGKNTALRRSGGPGSGGNTPTAARRRRPSERRSRHASSKKRRERQQIQFGSPFSDQLNGPVHLPVLPTIQAARARVFSGHLDGSRSAGATPVSVRRRRAALAEQNSTTWISRSVEKQRRNSISHNRRCPRPSSGDSKLLEGDKEADKKYRELIIEAEHILMAMRTSTPPLSGSPARRANSGPANKRVELLRNEECGVQPPISNCSNAVDVLKTSPVVCLPSPKKNHITNFINSNIALAGAGPSPATQRKFSGALGSPKRMVTFKPMADLIRHCPQSEPVKRKVYSPVAELPPGGFLFDVSRVPDEARPSENPVFQRQKLFHTITSLKKNLENQSETLRHTYHYGSNQRLPVVKH